MKLFEIRHLVAFLPLIKALEAQTLLSFSDATMMAWRAYGDFVEQYITAGVPLKQGTDFVFVTPPTSAAIRGGTPCPGAVTNGDLWSFADTLQSINDPLLDNSGASYVQSLDYYLNSVDLGIGNPTPAQLDKITQLQNALFAAQEKFWSVSDSAYAAYTADPQAQATKKTFAAWVVQKDPVYTAYKNAMRTANSALQTYTLQVYGPAYNTLTDQRAAIETLAQDGTELQPGYNMPDYGGTYNVQFTPFAPHTITDGLCYKPLYTLTGGFSETCDSWINGTGGTFSYTWSLKTSNFQDWSSLGHSTSVSQVGGSLFSILSATHSGTNVETQFNEWTSTSVNSISLQLTMNGAPTVFSIATGEWDVPSVRRTYPHLTSNGINQLSGHIRLTKLLLGHEVGCKITVADSATWKSVSQFIQDAKSDTGGGISIFGFYFGGSGSSVTHRNITDIQTSNQNTGGVIVIPPSRLGIPMLLGAFGKAV